MSLLKSQEIPHEIIQIISEFLPENDLYNLCQSNVFLWKIITKSSAIFKVIFQRECNFTIPSISIKKPDCNCRHLVCNPNNFMLITRNWNRIIFNSTNKHTIIESFQNKTFQPYVIYKSIWNKLFFNTKIFSVLCRILSFKYWSEQTIINLFSDACNYLITRELNSIELHLFSPVILIQENDKIKVSLDVPKHNMDLIPVLNFKQFQKTFNDLYYFNVWAKKINWNYFIISGSSVLAAVLNKNWTKHSKHDVDIYAHSMDYKTFKDFITKIRLSFIWPYVYYNTGHITTFELFIHEDIIITLQFIYICKSITSSTLNRIIENFDLDICQVLYNVIENKVLCTAAFIQSLKTEYIIPYRLLLSKYICQDKQIYRIKKYFYKGFNKMLIPKTLSVNVFQKLINKPHEHHQSQLCRYSHNIIACDYFDIQKKLLIYLNINRK